jgi:chromosome partitioning protein
MARVIAVGNLKGGTGKTTVAVNLACAMARRMRVCLIDADTQHAATDWTGGGTAPVVARHMPVAAGPGQVPDARFRAWAERVLALRRTCDLLVIDLPPHFENSVVGTLAVADIVVIPVTPGGAEIAATQRAKRVLDRARASRPAQRPLDCVLVPNRVDRRTAAGRAIGHKLSDLGESVGPTLRQRAAHMDAYFHGTWIGEAAPESEAHHEFNALVKFLRARLRF